MVDAVCDDIHGILMNTLSTTQTFIQTHTITNCNVGNVNIAMIARSVASVHRERGEFKELQVRV